MNKGVSHMSLPGDRLTVPTHQGPARVERTERGVQIQAPQGELTPNQARQFASAINSICQGPASTLGMQGQGQGSQYGSQQGQGGQQQYRDRS